MKILKFFGWALLSLFVLFLISLIIMAIFDYVTDDMEVKAVERTTENIDKDCISLFSAYLKKDYNSGIIEELLTNATDSDLILLQNGEQSYSQLIESVFNSHNLYFSFSKRTPVSFSSEGKVTFMEFSGLYTLSSFSPGEVRKLLLPTDTNWFSSLLSPTPSLQILEFVTKEGQTLYVINLDNEMSDQMKHSEINFSRLDYIKKSILEQLPKDAHIVIAGNWQNILPGQMIIESDSKGNMIPLSWTKTGWQWIYNPDDKTGYGVLVSDNVQIKDPAFFNINSEINPKALSLQLCLQ